MLVGFVEHGCPWSVGSGQRDRGFHCQATVVVLGPQGDGVSVVVSAATVLGFAVGRFLNVVIYRMPKMMERQWRAEYAALNDQEIPPAERFNLVAKAPSRATRTTIWPCSLVSTWGPVSPIRSVK